MTTDKDKKETPVVSAQKKVADKKTVAKPKKAAPKKATPEKVESVVKVSRSRKAPTKEVVGAVEKTVAIPEDKPKGKYPLDSMQPGDSFLVQCTSKNAKRIRLSIMGATRRVTSKTGAEFLVQIRPEEDGVRCWRTADNVEAKVYPGKVTEAKEPIPLTETADLDNTSDTGLEPVISPLMPESFKLDI